MAAASDFKAYIAPAKYSAVLLFGGLALIAGGVCFIALGGSASGNMSAGNAVALLMILGGISCALTGWLSRAGAARLRTRCLQRLDALGLSELAAQEFSLPANAVFVNEGLVLSPHFIYTKASGVVLRYEDIIWLFPREHGLSALGNLRRRDLSGTNALSGNRVSVSLAAYLADGSFMIIGHAREIPHATLEYIFSTVSRRNPRVLIGATPQNEAAYRAVVGAAGGRW